MNRLESLAQAGKTRLYIEISLELVERLNQAAKLTYRSRNGLVNKILEEYLDANIRSLCASSGSGVE